MGLKEIHVVSEKEVDIVKKLVGIARGKLDEVKQPDITSVSRIVKLQTSEGEVKISEIVDLNDDIYVSAAGIDPYVSGLIITVEGQSLYLPRRKKSVNSTICAISLKTCNFTYEELDALAKRLESAIINDI